jgi:hypothetical protein
MLGAGPAELRGQYGEAKKAPKKQAEKSSPFTKQDFERMVDKAMHPEKHKPDRG